MLTHSPRLRGKIFLPISLPLGRGPLHQGPTGLLLKSSREDHTPLAGAGGKWNDTPALWNMSQERKMCLMWKILRHWSNRRHSTMTSSSEPETQWVSKPPLWIPWWLQPGLVLLLWREYLSIVALMQHPLQKDFRQDEDSNGWCPSFFSENCWIHRRAETASGNNRTVSRAWRRGENSSAKANVRYCWWILCLQCPLGEADSSRFQDNSRPMVLDNEVSYRMRCRGSETQVFC